VNLRLSGPPLKRTGREVAAENAALDHRLQRLAAWLDDSLAIRPDTDVQLVHELLLGPFF